MVYSNFFILIALTVFVLALLGAVLIIGLACTRSRMSNSGNQQGPAEELDEQQAAEITATWNVLNH